jgi:hypothetical protein
MKIHWPVWHGIHATTSGPDKTQVEVARRIPGFELILLSITID